MTGPFPTNNDLAAVGLLSHSAPIPRMKAAALTYARMGWRIFPICYPDAEGNCACGGKWDAEQGQYVPHERREVGKVPIGSLAPHGFKDLSEWRWGTRATCMSRTRMPTRFVE